MNEPNFYQPPKHDQESRGVAAPPTSVDSVRFAIMFVANLPAPLLLAGLCVRSPIECLAMAPGIGILALVAWWLYQSPSRANRLLLGGWLLAASQLLPIVHIIVGMIVVSMICPPPANGVSDLTLFQTLVATIVCGLCFMSIALVVGSMLKAIEAFARIRVTT